MILNTLQQYRILYNNTRESKQIQCINEEIRVITYQYHDLYSFNRKFKMKSKFAFFKVMILIMNFKLVKITSYAQVCKTRRTKYKKEDF